MIYAAIMDNVVINVFPWSDEKPPADVANIHFVDITERPSYPAIGDIYDGGGFISAYIVNNTLGQIKADKIMNLRSNASSAILSEYPEYKQLNIQKWSDFGYTEQDYKNMVSYINNIRNRCNTIETLINSLASKEDVININIEL